MLLSKLHDIGYSFYYVYEMFKGGRSFQILVQTFSVIAYVNNATCVLIILMKYAIISIGKRAFRVSSSLQ